MTDSTSKTPGIPGTSDNGTSQISSARKTPAQPPVISTAPVVSQTAPPAGAAARSQQLIESTLVGNGDGLPPAGAKALRLTDPIGGGGAIPEQADKTPGKRPAPTGQAASDRPAEAMPLASAGTTLPGKASSSAPPPAPSEPTIPTGTAATTDTPTGDRVLIERRGGFFPLLLGGVAAAAIGAGTAWWAIPRYAPQLLPPPPSGQAVDLTSATAAIEARSIEVARKAATEAAEAAVNAAVASLPAASASSEAVSDAARQAAAEAGSSAGAEAARQAMTQIPDTNDALTQQLAALDKTVADLAARPAADPALAERLDRLTAELGDARARLDALQNATTEAARRSAAAATLAQALDHPVAANATASAVETLEQSGLTDAGRLGDVASLTDLRARWDNAARASLRAANAAGQTGTSDNALTSFLRAQTGARSVVPREGSDADAILSRAGDAVARGDIAQALTELDALPDAARKPMEPWQSDARAWVAASAAVSALSAADTGAAPAQPAAPADPAQATPAQAAPVGSATAPAQ